jgi:hypothetical protein
MSEKRRLKDIGKNIAIILMGLYIIMLLNVQPIKYEVVCKALLKYISICSEQSEYNSKTDRLLKSQQHQLNWCKSIQINQQKTSKSQIK